MNVNLCDLRLVSGFSDLTPKAQANKEKIDKLAFIKIRKLCMPGIPLRK